MMKHKFFWTGIPAVLAMAALILDSKTAFSGAVEGVTLCLYTVIPALFPFLVISTIINSSLTGRKITFMRPVGQLCGVPAGSESLLLLGLLGGYPVGAQAVTEAYRNGRLQTAAAHRLLGFCSNAGPSFIFGLVGAHFASMRVVWIIWMIHILSALIVGILLPGKKTSPCQLNRGAAISLPHALERSIRTMANVCGWVVLFRVIIAICNRWLFWLLPNQQQTIIIGFLELTNGCCNLSTIPSESLRFLLICCFLGCGGICVFMQTVSVTKDLHLGMYAQGKLLQTLVSFLLAGVLQRLLYPHDAAVPTSILIGISAAVTAFTIYLHRKSSSNIEKVVV